jgi:V/A-type H+/Na+-transporting ATPase subunit K
MVRFLCRNSALLLAVVVAFIILGGVGWGEEMGRATASGDQASASRTLGLAFAAALAIAVSVLGAGYAVGRIGSAALGAAAERPELLTKSILFVALAEGLAVLGFAIAMILTQKI